MSGLIPQIFIDELLARVPIAEVVSSRVQLKKSGATLKACCPFHQEKTPSFHVNSQKNFYHCFGCGMSGNAITFLREHDNLSFIEAVEELAKIAGLEVPRDQKVQQAYNEQKNLLEALAYASLRYREALKQHPSKAIAQDYLATRGLSENIIERFEIGYAPSQRDFLSATAPQNTRQALVKTKMVSDKYKQPFDLFQNRLMFPIRNPRGKTIAFGGRTLGDDKAKYINSPESEVFHKSNEIYGLYEASQANRQLDRLLVVEGYMDVVSLAQFGISYAVATLGTATNTDSLSQLLKRCQNIVFCFDGDHAGLQAARKAMENALPIFQDGMQLSFLLLPEGEDPDTLVREEGQQAFERRVDQAQPLSAFFFQIYSAGLNLEVAEQRGILKQRAEAQIELVHSVVLKSALRKQLNSLTFHHTGQARTKFKQAAKPRDLTSNKVIRDPDSACCLGLLYQPAKANELLSNLGDTQVYPLSREFAQYVLEVNAEHHADLVYSLATDMNGKREQFWHLFDRLEWVPSPDEAVQELDDILQRINVEKKRHHALRAAKLNKLPSQLTEDERQALQSMSTPKAE